METWRPLTSRFVTEIITAKAAAYHLESIIKSARQRLVLVSPYLKVSDVFLQRLMEAARRNVRTTLVYGKDELTLPEREKWKKFPDFNVLFLKNLHAKCYFNEGEMVITSMNLYDVSEGNRELGVRLRQGDSAFTDAVEEVESIIAAATMPTWWERARNLEPAPDATRRDQARPRSSSRRGYCVRCSVEIRLDVSRPFCVECYNVWRFFGNADYEENWCHDCGDGYPTSMTRPLCRSCYGRVALTGRVET